MQIEKNKEIIAPYAWKGADLEKSTDWIRRFSTDELAEIDAALRGVQRRGLEWLDVTREDFSLPGFASELAKIARELETGRGIVLLRGLPLTYTPDELRLVYWGIGAHLGTAVSQGGRGELLGIVEDEGKAVEKTKLRGSKTAGELSFHGDRCDVVGLLCVRKARSGGVSRIVSAAQIHNEVLLRLWLAVPGSRPLLPGYELLFGNIEGGAVRGGVASKEGWRDVNQLRERKRVATV